MPIPRNKLAALLAQIDQQIAEALKLATERDDDESLSRLLVVVDDLQQARLDVEGKLGAE